MFREKKCHRKRLAMCKIDKCNITTSGGTVEYWVLINLLCLMFFVVRYITVSSTCRVRHSHMLFITIVCRKRCLRWRHALSGNLRRHSGNKRKNIKANKSNMLRMCFSNMIKICRPVWTTENIKLHLFFFQRFFTWKVEKIEKLYQHDKDTSL